MRAVTYLTLFGQRYEQVRQFWGFFENTKLLKNLVHEDGRTLREPPADLSQEVRPEPDTSNAGHGAGQTAGEDSDVLGREVRDFGLLNWKVIGTSSL